MSVVEAGTPVHLSPSSAAMFDQCPRRWRFRLVERRPDPAGPAALVGTLAHRVLEELMAEPPGRRTEDRARELAAEVWPETAEDPQFTALALDPDDTRKFKWDAWRAITGLWAIEDPQDVVVYATEQRIETTISGIGFVGIVDRLDTTAKGLVVTDYKSGKPPMAGREDEKLHQVLLYAAALEAHLDLLPAAARLHYLGARSISIEVTRERVDEAVDRLRSTRQALDEAHASDEFAPRTGPLCGWCPFVADCPEGTTEVRDRYDSGRIRASAPAIALVA